MLLTVCLVLAVKLTPHPVPCALSPADAVTDVVARARAVCPSGAAPTAVAEEEAEQLRALARESTHAVQAAHRQAVVDANKASQGAPAS